MATTKRNTINKEDAELLQSSDTPETNSQESDSVEPAPTPPRTYPIQEGIRGRDGGPYLDDVERRRLAEYRGIRENREPDYTEVEKHESMVPAHRLFDNLNSNPGSRGVDPLERFVLVPKEDSSNVAPVVESSESDD